jgi:hypothetical protein
MIDAQSWCFWDPRIFFAGLCAQPVASLNWRWERRFVSAKPLS